jgi:hypothetical protein
MLVAVTTIAPARQGDGFQWFPMEVPHLTIADVAAALARDGVIYGEKLDTIAAPGRVRKLRAKIPLTLGRGFVGTIVPLELEYEV